MDLLCRTLTVVAALCVCGENKLYGHDGSGDSVYQILDETFVEGATIT